MIYPNWKIQMRHFRVIFTQCERGCFLVYLQHHLINRYIRCYHKSSKLMIQNLSVFWICFSRMNKRLLAEKVNCTLIGFLDDGSSRIFTWKFLYPTNLKLKKNTLCQIWQKLVIWCKNQFDAIYFGPKIDFDSKIDWMQK